MRQILIESCGECPYYYEGEISDYGERWSDDFCIKGCGDISDKTKVLDTCKLFEVF
jgi:hypothetical protein